MSPHVLLTSGQQYVGLCAKDILGCSHAANRKDFYQTNYVDKMLWITRRWFVEHDREEKPRVMEGDTCAKVIP
jgi:hypothetical protein